MTSTKDKAETTDVATTRRPSTEQLREVTDFESALALLQKELGATVVTSDVLGDGFTLLEDKDQLIGMPLMFVSWSFSEGDFGEFVAARVIAQMPNNTYMKYVIIDGGTGICAQLKDIDSRENGSKVLVAARGLRKSEYDHPIHGHGVTHYIDTAAAR